MMFHEEISRNCALSNETIVQFGFLSWVNVNSKDVRKLFV